MDKNYLDLIQVLGDKKENNRMYQVGWSIDSAWYMKTRDLRVTVWKRFIITRDNILNWQSSSNHQPSWH